MKKYLIKKAVQQYRANLHLHSILSDGMKTPEELKKDYKDNGYSIIAFTDHDKYLNHNDLTDDNFVVLNGFELEYYITPWRQKCCHLCFIAENKNNEALGYSDINTNPFIRELAEGKTVKEKGGSLYTCSVPERIYDYHYINEDIKKAKELGFFVTYNHPTWSLESYPDYINYEGMDAMEIANFNCLSEGYDEDDGRVYNDLLNKHKKIYCIATDDNHNEQDDNGPYCDSYGGYIMLTLDKLNYENVIKALKSGEFYSCAKVSLKGECPNIKELSFEDGMLHLECTPAKRIQLIKNIRKNKHFISDEELLTSADFEIDDCEWFRVVVEDEIGNKAYSNAYFLSQLNKD